jgi:hypothetical protein
MNQHFTVTKEIGEKEAALNEFSNNFRRAPEMALE